MGAFRGWFLSAAAVVLLPCLCADAQLVTDDGPPPYGEPGTLGGYDESALAPEFSFGIGWAHIAIDDSVLDSEDAIRFDPAVSFAPIAKLPQLRLGAALGVSLVLDNSERAIVSNGGVVIVGHSDVPLWFLEPELRASWRQYFGNQGQFFVEPGVAGGAIIGELHIEADDTAFGQSFDEWASTGAARAFLNVGARVTGGLAGLEVAYLRGGTLDFAENASGEVEQFYIGFFGAIRF
jgi:hypothetical protein